MIFIGFSLVSGIIFLPSLSFFLRGEEFLFSGKKNFGKLIVNTRDLKIGKK